MDREAFDHLVREALVHLHDRLYLATHPLASLLGSDGRPLSGDLLRQSLVDVLDELRPIGAGQVHDASWRRYRHLVLRHAEGQTLEQVAHALGVSVRQATRDHRQGVASIADILWLRCRERVTELQRLRAPTPAAGSSDHHADDDLAAEAAKIAAKSEGATDLPETIEGILITLRNLAADRGITFATLIADTLPPVAMSRTLLRQAMLNLLIYATELAPRSQLLLAGTDTARGVTLRVVVQPATASSVQRAEPLAPTTDAAALLATGRQLLEAQGGSVELGHPATDDVLLIVVLPPVQLRTVLVVDDNPDVVALFRRYLREQPYRVIQATSGASALRVVGELQPDAIVLDVMLPSLDGWDILQQLRGRAETRDVPVIVCSVLPERTLALSLGVSDFLAKPVTRPALLAALQRCHPMSEVRPGHS